MKYQAGFIGVGNMGGALASAVHKSVSALALCDRDTAKVQRLCDALTGASVTDADELAANAQFVFLAVKPNVILSVAASFAGNLAHEATVVTMAAGVSLAEITAAAGTNRVIRIMPNTPAAVGEGMILYCCANGVSAEDEAAFLRVMERAGKILKLDESLFDAAAALSGCGPAYVYLFAQALADGAVACGVPRDQAALLAAQTLRGGAEMLLKSGKHPEQLKDEVCSPGGTTIAGVMELEKGGVRAAAANAVIAAYEKTAKLKK